MRPTVAWQSILTICLLMSTAFGATNMDPRRISVLYTGDPYPGITPYPAMVEDAFIDATPVQACYNHYAGISGADIRKSMRVYMARSYEDYRSKYDVMILSDSFVGVFTSGQIFWFRDGVVEDGIGLIMVGGWESFGRGWQNSPVEEVLPVEFPNEIWVSGNIPIEITSEGYGNPFIRSLPYKPLPEYMRIGTDGNYVEQKAGSELLARWRVQTIQYEDPPCYVTWEIGEGRTFALCHDWTPAGGTLMAQWDHYRDYVINLMLYLAKRDLPDNPVEVHEYRESIHILAIGKSMLFSLMGFVESFGGNSGPIGDEIGTLDDMVAEAKELYLDQDFSGALERAQDAIGKLKEIEKLSVDIKEQALFWVYVIEWLSVTGVSLLAGSVLWLLMVRRRLYREVSVTKFGEG